VEWEYTSTVSDEAYREAVKAFTNLGTTYALVVIGAFLLIWLASLALSQ